METPIKGRWVVVNTDPFCIGKIVDLSGDIAKIRIEGYRVSSTHVPGRITWIAENVWELEIPRSAAMALSEAYITESPEFPVKFSYFAPDKEAVEEVIEILKKCGYHTTGVAGPQAYFVANISEAGVVHVDSKRYTCLDVFECRTIDEFRALAGFRRLGNPQYYVDPCGLMRMVYGIPDPADRLATLSEVINMLYAWREQPTDYLAEVQSVPEVPDIVYPTGFIGMELRIPVDGNRKAKATIDSVCGQTAFIRIEDGYHLEGHPDLLAELVYRGGGYELYKCPLHQAIMYDRYMQNKYPAVRVCTPGTFKEHLLNLLKDMGYIIKDTHEGNGPAYLHVSFPYCDAECKCTSEEIVDNSYDCMGDTRLFLNLARQNGTWPYVVDESGIIFKLDAEHDKDIRVASIHELVPYLQEPLKKAPRLSRCMDCDDPINAPGDAFAVWDEVWASAKCDPNSMLCPECFEKRLGRPLTIHDLRRVYKEGMNGKRYEVGQLMPINVEFAYTKGWLHE